MTFPASDGLGSRKHPPFPAVALLGGPFLPERLFWSCKTCQGAGNREQAACESFGANGFKNKPKRRRGAAAKPPDSSRIVLHMSQTHPWALAPARGVYWDTQWWAPVCIVCVCACKHVCALGVCL